MSDESVDPRKAPFLYTAKASRSERDKGCGHLYWRQDSDSYVRITSSEYEALEDDDDVRVASGSIHPTVKPVEIMEWLVERLSEPGDTVLDPFAGSGTTGIAAMKQGRSCRLVELDEEGAYEDIISGRLHGWRHEMLDEANPWNRPDIEFGGVLSDEDPNEVPDEVSIDSLFGFGS